MLYCQLTTAISDVLHYFFGRYNSKKNQEVKMYLTQCLSDKYKGTTSPRRIKSEQPMCINWEFFSRFHNTGMVAS